MRFDGQGRRFTLACIAVAAFVLLTAADLPAVVATHFRMDGSPDGYLSRHAYTVGALLLAVALPAALTLLAGLLGRLPDGLLNLPHRQHWLQPERRPASIAFMAGLCRYFAAVLLLFLCFVHGLIVMAHAQQPLRLDTGSLLIAAGVLLLAVTAGVVAMLRRFPRPA
ncbi:MAG: DUF1648 domain-containing protein [Moraxellaceae bacterium]|nr:DUF1648 domain-containing protein [Moraxellaceae bacterium]